MRRPEICFLVLAASTLAAEKAEPLPQTALWNFPDNIVTEQYRELRDFYGRQIREAAPRREAFGRKTPDEQRKRLRELTGAIDQPMQPKPTRTLLGETADYSASLVSWPLLRMGTQPPTRGSAGTLVRCYGVLLEPQGAGKHPAVIALPDATQSAADIAGLTGRVPESGQPARRLQAQVTLSSRRSSRSAGPSPSLGSKTACGSCDSHTRPAGMLPAPS